MKPYSPREEWGNIPYLTRKKCITALTKAFLALDNDYFLKLDKEIQDSYRENINWWENKSNLKDSVILILNTIDNQDWEKYWMCAVEISIDILMYKQEQDDFN